MLKTGILLFRARARGRFFIVENLLKSECFYQSRFNCTGTVQNPIVKNENLFKSARANAQ